MIRNHHTLRKRLISMHIHGIPIKNTQLIIKRDVGKKSRRNMNGFTMHRLSIAHRLRIMDNI